MRLFVIPFLCVIPWLPFPQEIHSLTFPVFAALLLVASLRSKLNLSLGVNSILWLTFVLWGLFRLEPGREWNTVCLSDSLLLMSLVLLLSLEKARENWPILLAGLSLVLNLGLLFIGYSKLYQYGPLNQESHFQGFNLICLWVLIAHLFTKASGKNHLRSAFYGISIAIILISMAMSGAKAVQLTVFVALIGVAVLYFFKTLRLQSWLLYMTIPLWLVGVGIILPIGTGLADPIGSSSSILARQDLWLATWRMIQSHWLWGVGNYSYLGWIRDYWSPLSELKFINEVYPPGAHNWFLNVWAELGFIGLAIALTITYRAILLPSLRYLRSGDKSALLAASFSGAYVIFCSATFASYGFITSMVALLVITTFHEISNPGWTLQINYRLMRLLSICLILGMSVNSLPLFHDFNARSTVKEIFLNHRVAGLKEVADLESSLQESPNSIASFYASGVFLQNRDFDNSLSLIKMTSNLSGSRWPIERRWFEWYAMQGRCSENKHIATKIRDYIHPSQLQWISPQSTECYRLLANQGKLDSAGKFR